MFLLQFGPEYGSCYRDDFIGVEYDILYVKEKEKAKDSQQGSM